MLPHNRIRLSGFIAAAVALLVLPTTPTSAQDQVVTNLGPVANDEPIIANVGSKRVTAFYLKDGRRCALHTLAFDKTVGLSGMTEEGLDPADTAVRVRIRLEPGQVVHVDTVDNETLSLRCGEKAKSLAIVDNADHIAFGNSAPKYIKATASGF